MGILYLEFLLPAVFGRAPPVQVQVTCYKPIECLTSCLNEWVKRLPAADFYAQADFGENVKSMFSFVSFELNYKFHAIVRGRSE